MSEDEMNAGYFCIQMKGIYRQSPIDQQSSQSMEGLLDASRKTKTQVEAEVRGIVVVAVRHPSAPRIDEPTTTTEHTARATVRTCRVRDREPAIRTKIVPNPLPNISTHIIESKTVRFLQTDSMAFLTTIFTVPSYFIDIVASSIFELLSTSSRIFPFCFGGQSIPIGCPIAFYIFTIDGIYWIQTFFK